MAASQHRSKRHVQTSIASYFDKDTADATAQLDLETQADLMNVGMRVRKSVPEGYKTHKTLQPARPTLSVTQSYSQTNVQHCTSRELAPFSGLHKTGGLSQQESWSLTPAEDDMPSLTSSQETVSSTQSEGIQLRRKRSYEDEEQLDIYEGMESQDMLATRVIAQPKAFDRRRRMLDLLERNDFQEAQFLQPHDFDMNEEYD